MERLRTRHLEDPLPTLEHLAAALERPLEEGEKLPITEDMFDGCISINPDDICSREQLGAVFKVGRVGPAVASYFPAAASPAPPSITEDGYHSFWDHNVASILQLLIPQGKCIRNSIWHAETRMLRPDFGFLINNLCVFRGEEKGPTTSGDPVEELISKMGSSNWPYEPAPYILGNCRLVVT